MESITIPLMLLTLLFYIHGCCGFFNDVYECYTMDDDDAVGPDTHFDKIEQSRLRKDLPLHTNTSLLPSMFQRRGKRHIRPPAGKRSLKRVPAEVSSSMLQSVHDSRPPMGKRNLQTVAFSMLQRKGKRQRRPPTGKRNLRKVIAKVSYQMLQKKGVHYIRPPIGKRSLQRVLPSMPQRRRVHHNKPAVGIRSLKRVLAKVSSPMLQERGDHNIGPPPG